MTEDAVGALVIGVCAVFVGVLLWGVTRAAATGSIENNMLVGIRTSRTMASQEDWQVGHAAALPWATRLMVGTVALGVLSIVALALGRPQVGIGIGLAAMVLVLVGVFPVVRAAHRAIDERRADLET